MNRGETLKKADALPAAEDYGSRGIYFGDVNDLINEIHDDFESRVCDNCWYWAKNKRKCDNPDAFAYDSNATVVKGDGCNKFVRKLKKADHGRE